jgi:redox-sensing transcriptional repressor
VEALLRGIEAHLGYNGVNRALLVGAGRLGAALLGHDKFHEYGLEIVAAFDVSPAKIGERLNGIEVLPLTRLPDVAREMNAQLGIITVPAEAAQEVVDLLVENGIHAIWNFAPATLRIPAGVIVQNEDLYRSLATLSHRLVMKYQGERNSEPTPVEEKTDEISA